MTPEQTTKDLQAIEATHKIIALRNAQDDLIQGFKSTCQEIKASLPKFVSKEAKSVTELFMFMTELQSDLGANLDSLSTLIAAQMLVVQEANPGLRESLQAQYKADDATKPTPVRQTLSEMSSSVVSDAIALNHKLTAHAGLNKGSVFAKNDAKARMEKAKQEAQVSEHVKTKPQ